MKLRLKEDPKEWRKAALLSLGGLAMISSLLAWRKVLSQTEWLEALGGWALIAALACVAPRLFRGYYRFSHRLGFHLARAMGFIVLGVVFALVITPLGFVLRAFGQDSLRLKRPGKAESYWNVAKPNSPLDRMF